MEEVSYQNVRIHRCTACKGLWFDMLQDEDLRSLPGSEAVDIGNAAVGRQYNTMQHVECPVCHTPMLRMVDAEQPHIWYESCSVCFGVFFDAGEFRDYKASSIADFFRDLFARERP